MKKVSLYILLVLMMGTSCRKELLDPVPSNRIADLSAFDTPERIATQVTGMYVVVKNGDFYGGKYIITQDVRGNDFVNEFPNGFTLLQTWNMNVTNNTQEVLETWAQAYLAINNINVFIDGMNEKGLQVTGEAAGKKYIAEARFLRALSYFALLQLYARPYWDGNGEKPGVVVYTEGNTSAGKYAKARSKTSEVYKLILDDLDAAEAGLPDKYANAALNTNRAHKNSAIALKTRVYLCMQQYAKVITEANKIVSATAPFTAATGVPHALQPKIANVFSTYTTTESIFSFPFTTVDAPGTQMQLGYYFTPGDLGGGGEYSLDPKGIITDPTWTADDDRRKLLAVADGKTFLIKYPTGDPFTDWAPVLRYAEVLLNLAEARVRTTNSVDPQAVALLNAVRNRSDATTTYTVASFANATALLNAILKERHIEFLGEGMRSLDILRLGQNFPAKGTRVGEVSTTSPQYIWPISAAELTYNKLCVDNK